MADGAELNVRDYGAGGAGADDTQAIVAAVQDAEAPVELERAASGPCDCEEAEE